MKIIFSKTFIKQLKKSPRKIQLAFRDRLEVFLSNPNHPILNNHHLVGKLKGYQSINITGDWRAIFRMIGIDVIYFDTIGTHSQLYR